MKINDTDALLVIDAQPTFMPGGGLPVKEGHHVVSVIRSLHPLFGSRRFIGTKDRHPRGHISLASSFIGVQPYDVMASVWDQHLSGVQIAPHAKFVYEDAYQYFKRLRIMGTPQVLWPDHAIAGTEEAEIHPDLHPSLFGYVLVKGTDPRCDSYSAFRDNLKRPTELADVLRERGVRRIFCTGLAFDYCVGYTALDGAEAGFEVFVVEDATRPVGFPEGQVEQTREAFANAGVCVIDSKDLLR